MSKLTIHAGKTPSEGYIAIDGERLEGVDAVMVTQTIATGQVSVQFLAHVGDIEVDWSEWEATDS